jgi:hypothetical protein
MTNDWNVLVIAAIFIGLFMLALVSLSRKGVHLPAVRDHQVLTTFVALALVIGGVAYGAGLFSISTTSVQQISQPSTNFELNYVLGYFQTGTTSPNLKTELATLSGQNGVEILAPTNGIAFTIGATSSATANAVFSVELVRMDTITQNMTFSATLTSIPSITNTTTQKTYSLVLLNAQNSPEVYFNNNTQIANVFVHYVNYGSYYTFTISVALDINAVLSMSVYGTATMDLNIAYGGAGQTLTIPVELIRTA